MLGAGVYVLVGEIARVSGGAIWLPLLTALVLACLTAGSYAELATKYPKAGGSAHYVTRAIGPAAGTFVGFCMLAAGVVSVGALAKGFASDYLAALVTLPTVAVVVVFLLVLAALNMRGIKESLGANVIATAIELSGLLLVIGLGGWVLARGGGDPARLTRIGTAEQGAIGAVLGGAVLAYYSFVGFETSVNLAEEVRDPRRTYPRALFGALLTAGAVYVLTGEVASLAATLVLLLLVVFTAVNVAVLILRREPGEADHFRVPVAVPWLGLASCLFLFTRIDAQVWLRGAILLGLGVVLGIVNAVRTRSAAGPETAAPTRV
ncbi:APC family permease [Nocardia xishanensis]